MRQVLSLIFGIFLTVSLASCSDETEFEVTTYIISRSGGIYTDEYFDVIHVYGFLDNREVVHQIVEYLNESEPNTYLYHPAE